MATQPKPQSDLGRPRDTQANNPTRAREVVTVWFKEHIAWLDLQHERPREIMENGLQGPQKRKVFYKEGPVIRIRGLAYPVGQVPEGFGDKPLVINGYALTPNIDKAWWDTWLEQHQDYPAVKNGFLFATPSRSEGQAIARDHEGGRPQFSPIDPRNDHRTPRPATPDMSPLAMEDERARRMRSQPVSAE